MSRLSSLYSRLKQCQSMKAKAEELLRLIELALNYYSSTLSSQLPRLVAQANVFETSVGYINQPLSYCSGNKINSIKSLVSGLAGYTGFSSQVSKLQSDVEKTHGELSDKQARVLEEIEHLEYEISSLKQLIAEEEERLAEEARKNAEDKKNNFKAEQADRL